MVITGASAGLGKATAKLFHEKGWRVIATMRNPENETELTSLANVTILKLDVTDVSEIQKTVEHILGHYSVDLVINNAGYGLIGVLEAMTDEQVNRQITTNVLGVIRVIQSFLPHFRKQRKGVFINITSMYGLVGYPTCALYSATKFAIEGFSESLAYELAPFGIKVKTVAPGGIQTNFAGRSLDGAFHEAYHSLTDKVSQGYSQEKVSQYSRPESVAQVIYEAATDERNQLRYLAGPDAESLYLEREERGAETQYERVRSWVVS